MRWTPEQLAAFQRRRLADGSRTSASVRKPRRQRIEPSELEVHLAVVEHLRHRARPGVVWWHTPNGEHRDPRTAAKLKRMGVLAGVPDLLLLTQGRLYALELKSGGGCSSAAQSAVLSLLRGSGAHCVVAWGVNEALAALEAWGLLTRESETPRETGRQSNA